MNRLKRLVQEIHRRSLWQVLGVYLVVSWIVFEVVQTLTEGLGLPEWFPGFAFGLLLIGLPIVMATAFVQDGGSGGEVPAAGSEPSSPIPAVAEPPRAFPARLLTWRNALGGGVLAFALWGVVAAGWLVFGGGAPAGEPGDDPLARTIAVLPFDNLSADPENEYFAGGIHEEILTNLARISDLTVISRTSVLPYRDSEKSLREIAGELGAGVVLEGSVQKADDRVRITTQLVDARTDAHLWAERYDRRLDDVFAVQTDIARRIADQLRATILPGEEERIARVPTAVPEAYEAYLRGLDDLGESQREEPIRRALEAFRRAVELDPTFAAAHARLARSHMQLFWYGHDRAPERLARARGRRSAPWPWTLTCWRAGLRWGGRSTRSRTSTPPWSTWGPWRPRTPAAPRPPTWSA